MQKRSDRDVVPSRLWQGSPVDEDEQPFVDATARERDRLAVDGRRNVEDRAEVDVDGLDFAGIDRTNASAPYGRAEFIAVRRAIVEEWQPKGGIELQLIDTLTQAYVMQQ